METLQSSKPGELTEAPTAAPIYNHKTQSSFSVNLPILWISIWCCLQGTHFKSQVQGILYSIYCDDFQQVSFKNSHQTHTRAMTPLALICPFLKNLFYLFLTFYHIFIYYLCCLFCVICPDVLWEECQCQRWISILCKCKGRESALNRCL